MTTKHLEIVHNELDLLAGEIASRQSSAKAPDLGRLTAEAVQASYTSAAKAFESLKEPVKDRTAKLETALRGLDDTMKALDEFIAKINDTGSLVAAQIDEANALSAEIRKTISDYVAKVK